MAASKQEIITSQGYRTARQIILTCFSTFRQSATQWGNDLNAKFTFYTGSRNLVVAAKP